MHKIQLGSPENKSQKNLERKSHTHKLTFFFCYIFIFLFFIYQFYYAFYIDYSLMWSFFFLKFLLDKFHFLALLRSNKKTLDFLISLGKMRQLDTWTAIEVNQLQKNFAMTVLTFLVTTKKKYSGELGVLPYEQLSKNTIAGNFATRGGTVKYAKRHF